MGECNYSFDLKSGDHDHFEIDIYELDCLRERAEFVAHSKRHVRVSAKFSRLATFRSSRAS
jgi:hypothetical protein